MEKYYIFKSCLMVLMLVIGFGLFVIRVKRLIQLMLAVKGKKEFKPDRIQARIKVLLSDVIGQSNVLRKPIPGFAHMLIFFGFLAIQPHSIEMMIQGVFHKFAIANTLGGYLKIADTVAVFVLIGLGYGLYRRLIKKPDYLTNGRDAKLIILFTAVIIVSFYSYNSFYAVLPGYSHDVSQNLTISASLASGLSLASLSGSAQIFGLEVSYWVHLLTILGFLIYIPGSKHLHLLAAIPNVFLKSLEVENPMVKTDIEDEEVESFGLGRVSEMHWKNVLDLYACTECGRCQERCPADRTGKPLSPKKIISHLKHELIDHGDVIIDGEDVEIIPPLVSPDNEHFNADVIWSCTTCRACEDICPVNIEHLDILLETRKNQVLMEASFPHEMQDTFNNLENQSNPWGFSSDSRGDWCKGMDIPLMTDHPEADLLYFVGCAGSFDDQGIKISKAIATILKKADIDFAILGPEERCNGDVARRSGNEYLAQMMIQENVDLLSHYRPKKILTGCPHCYNIMKNEYPGFGGTFDVVHHLNYFYQLIKQGKLELKSQDFGNITFHDSCYLGRWNHIYETPRKLLTAINQGRPPVEMKEIKDNAMCCGAGGARMFMEETIGSRINSERAKQVLATKADIVAAGCPFCITMLKDGIAENNDSIPVKDVSQILAHACK
ncbi:MAG: (Fe-S)-binding protein [Desulfobacteraceae bacterium]|nr:(Fe-S)-binding protein [Desulfobacteraceae bacterium]